MRRFLAAAGLAAAGALTLPGVAAPAAAQAQRDWTRTVVATPEGGFRMGNPAARVKLVEYLSLTCPHCAEFAQASEASLFSNYVRSGRVSVEYRNFILTAPDVAAATLARCATPRAYFAMSQELLRTQPQWTAGMNSLTPAQRAQLRGLQPLALVQRLVPVLGLDRIAARHGLTPAAQRDCLASQANLDRLENGVRAASELGVQGTPTFFINGARAHAHSWEELEPLIRQAGG